MGARRRCSTLAALALLLGAVCELAGAGTPSKKCKKGVRASTRCFFAAGSDALGDYVQTFVDEGFETANDFIENELTVEDYEGLGIEEPAVVQEIQRMVHALANPPPPPPAKTYNRELAPQLIEAVKTGDIPEMERLLQRGASPNHKVPTGGEDSLRWSAVRWAAMKGSEARTAEEMERDPLLEHGVEVLQLLLAHGGDIDQTDESGQTALHTACFLGESRRDIIEALLEAGAETDIVGRDGFSPLHWAAKQNNLGIPTLLEEYGAEIDLGDNYDMTPLFIASDRQFSGMVNELLSLGADPNYGLESDVIKPRLHLTKVCVCVCVCESTGTFPFPQSCPHRKLIRRCVCVCVRARARACVWRKGITPLMVAVMPINSKDEHTTLATVSALLAGGADPYQPDGEGMTVFDRSRCREGAGWLETNEARSEFHKVCKRLDQAKDDAKEQRIMGTEVAQLFAEHLDKTDDGVQRSWSGDSVQNKRSNL